MRRWPLLILLVLPFVAQPCFGQDSVANPATPSAAPADSPKPKKVYTNDDINGKNGVSVVGDERNRAYTPGTAKSADPAIAAKLKANLQKLQAQLDDLDKQLAALQDFQKGEANSRSGYPINKGYGRVPVDQQITALEEKKKKIETQIDAIHEEARKKGVQPGQLR